MKIIKNIEDLNNLNKIILTIGMFDGFHLGHQKIIDTLVQSAEQNNCQSAIITFKNHPLEILAKESAPKLITYVEDKLDLISSYKVNYLCLLEFTHDFSKLSHNSFLKKISQNFKFFGLVLGYNFKFGYKNMGNIDYLKEKQKEKSFFLKVVEPIKYNDIIISSSKIRKLVQCGNVSTATKVLGRHYFIKGNIRKGKGIGRQISFPTANIISKKQVYPKYGVYKTKFEIDNNIYPSMTYVGRKSSFITNSDNSKTNELPLIETHVFNFSKDIYNKEVKIHFVNWLREPREFLSLQELKDQLNKDKYNCK